MAGYGNRTGIISSFTDLGVSDKPDVRGYRAVFDPQVDKRTNDLLTDWSGNRRQWQDLFGKWQTDFNAQTPEITANVTKENDFLKWLRDGGLEAQLSGIRGEENAADVKAQKNALDFADTQAGAASLAAGSGGGRTSSADYARRLRSGTRISDEFAQRAPARERSDLGTVINTKLSTQGRINDNLQKLINRELQPQQLSDAELRELVGSLGGITNIRNAISQPVFWRKKSGLEKTGDVLDTLADSAYKGLNAYSSFSGLGGGLGGGGGGGGGDAGAAPAAESHTPYSAGMSYGGAPASGGTNFVEYYPGTASRQPDFSGIGGYPSQVSPTYQAQPAGWVPFSGF